MGFGEHARALRAGDIAFGRFVELTRVEWARAARSLHRRWVRKLPAWYTVDDVEQDMVLGAFRAHAHPAFTARPPTTNASAFLLWNAEKFAQKAIHKVRGCEQHTRRGPSRFELLASALERPRRDGGSILRQSVIEAVPTPATQHDACERAEAEARAIAGATSVEELLATRALIAEGGSLDAAAARLYEDAGARLALRAGCEGEVVDVVRKVAREILRRERVTAA